MHAMRCPRCDYKLSSGNRFCGRCGLAQSENPIDPLLGIVVADRYRIEKRIGVGGMGTVYLGLHARIGQKVAIKVLHERYAHDKQLTRRFENEALTYGRLSHPNLVTLHDYGHDQNNTFFMVLEYCPGIALSKYLRERGRLSEVQAVNFVVQLAQGLSTAHQAGVIHRDLKPENVILMETRPGHHHLKLLDFGIAKAIDDEGPRLTQAGMVFGTPEYMAPEQARGDLVDARSDIYALGSMLYELLCGRPPFTGSNKMTVMHHQANERPKPPSEHNPNLSKVLERIILRCLEKAPKDRYQSAELLIQAMESLELSSKVQVEGEAPRERSSALPPEALTEASEQGKVDAERTPASPLGLDLSITPPRDFQRPPGPSGGTLFMLAMLFVGVIAAAALIFSAPEGSSRSISGALKPQGDSQSSSIQDAAQVAFGEDLAGQKERIRREAERQAAEKKRKAAAEKKRKAAAEKKRKAAAEKKRKAIAEKKRRAAAEKKRKAAEKRKGEALREARKKLKSGQFKEALKALSPLKKREKEAERLRGQIREAQKSLAQGKRAYDAGRCVKALKALEMVQKLAPGTQGLSHMMGRCRDSAPPLEDL